MNVTSMARSLMINTEKNDGSDGGFGARSSDCG